MTWSSSKSKAKDYTPKAFKRLRKGTAEQIQAAAQGRGPTVDAYKGQLVAGMEPGEQSALESVAALGAGSASDRQGERYLRSSIAGQELDFYNDPAFQEMLDFAGRRFVSGFNAEEEANKALFARAGHQLPNSSPFAEAQGRISDAKAQGLADLSAQLIGTQFADAKQRQFESVGQLSNLETDRLARARETLEAESLPRLIKDMGLERGREEYARRQELIMKALGLQLEAASPHLASTSKQSSGGIL